jgi:hypothetical protein
MAIDAIPVEGRALGGARVSMDGTSNAEIRARALLGDRVGDCDVSDDGAFRCAIDDGRFVGTGIQRGPC